MRASLVATIFTTPFWVVKTRLALYRESHGSEKAKPGRVIWNVVREMAVHEGPTAFFKGLGPSVILSSYGIIQMYCYENITHMLGYKSG